MSDDELVVAIGCVILAAVFGLRALGPVVTLSSLQTPWSTRLVVLGTWALAMAIVHGTLTTIAAWDVRASGLYTGFYDVMGLAWIACSIAVLHRYGLSLRDDVLERRNHAALAALSGATIGLAVAFSGGNVGDGPGWWCVVIASGLATLSLFAVWIVLHLAAKTPETITVERDVGAGIRVGALLAACGMIFGSSAAGNWVSLPDTLVSFAASAWPAVVVAAIGVGVEVLLAPRPDRARPGLAVAFVASVAYLGTGLALVRWQGMLL